MKNRIGLLIAYNGSGFHGLQFNSPFRTIEQEIILSLLKLEAIKESNTTEPHKIGLKRTSRTDKGVHAAMCLLICKVEVIPDDTFFNNLKNDLLPKNIHLYKIIKLSARFNPQKECTSRIYEYYLPTFVVNTDFCKSTISEDNITLFTNLMKKYEGTKSYHNFTAKSNEKGLQRFIRHVTISSPIDVEGNEYLKIVLEGNSFLLHQIRKMVGYVISLIRFRNEDASNIFENAFLPESIVIPKAPSNFLLLYHQKFDAYNKKPLYEHINVCDGEKDEVKKVLIEKEIFNQKNLDIFKEWFILFEKYNYNFDYLNLN